MIIGFMGKAGAGKTTAAQAVEAFDKHLRQELGRAKTHLLLQQES